MHLVNYLLKLAEPTPPQEGVVSLHLLKLGQCGYDLVCVIPSSRWDVDAVDTNAVSSGLGDTVRLRMRYGAFVRGAQLFDRRCVPSLHPCTHVDRLKCVEEGRVCMRGRGGDRQRASLSLRVYRAPR